jgi:hypothetical protein
VTGADVNFEHRSYHCATLTAHCCCGFPGENSWKEILTTVKTHIFRSKSQEPQTDMFLSLASRQREQRLRRTLERLKIRKAVLFMAIMSCIAFFTTATLFVSKNHQFIGSQGGHYN